VDTDKRIVLAMAELMRAQGYATTSVKQIAEAAGAPVGSIYHHFPGGKHAIAKAALRQAGATYLQLLPVLLDPHPDLAEAIRQAFAQAAEDLAGTGWANLCPVATVAGEIATADPALRAVAAEVFDDWITRATAYLTTRDLPAAAAQDLAYALISALEGAFILARAQRRPAALHATAEALAAYVGTLRTAPAVTGR
jgi:AcrR family transcriptional regulator